MRGISTAVLTALAIALLAAQSPQSSAPVPRAQEIVVTGPTEAAVERLVAALTETRGGRQVPRWNGHICPKILGLDPGSAAFILQRLHSVARELRIPVETRRCRGNIVIVVTGDADEFAAILVRKYPRLFRGPRDNFASPSELAQLRAPRPVRWIAATDTGNSEGRPGMGGYIRIYSASRITLSSRENMALSFIIVDADRLQNLTWGQLADYLTLVALTRPAMDAVYDSSTVMSLFSQRDIGAPMPGGLTRQDRAFLKALYTTNAAARAAEQRAAIKRVMVRSAAAAPE